MVHRKTRGIYDKALTYEKLYAAWNTVSHTCKNRRGLYEFSMHQQARVAKILEDLKARNYYPNKYRCFMIFEPKPRLVMSQSIRDKVVNHFVAQEYLLPLLDMALIDTNVATRYGKGSSYVSKMLRRYFAQLMAAKPGATIYALKIDISKYFYSIDHEILFEKLRKRVKDGDVLEILHRIVNETNQPYINSVIDGFNKYYGTTIPHYINGKGLSIGAMTSQFLAIYYLNDLDHYIKEKLHCKYYIRYMDDFLFLSHDKEELKRVKVAVESELVKLKLVVNPKSAIYNCMSLGGFSFLGYRYYVTRARNIYGGMLRVDCLANTVKRVRRRLLILEKHNKVKYDKSYESYRGYFMHTLPVYEMEQYVGKKLV